MNSDWRVKFKALVPAAVRRRLRRWRGGGTFTGDHATWARARAASGGYDAPAIFERTLAAARAVRDGRAAWERDTVLFADPACNRPLLAALRQAAAAEGGRLHVLDFGGALGSTWFQHRAWLADLAEVRWGVVEQPALVAAGKRELAAGPLRFHATLAEGDAAESPAVMLLSSVLPYLEAPHALLAEVRARGFRHLIIDRTGFVRRGRDRLTVQRVPPAIYPASYPCWFFDRAALLRPFAPGWRLAAEWATDDEVDIDARYGGLYLERIP
ncbi:MAG: methyltransferase, TIGR04325 family [Verrucomicrobiota bacterium]